jgi:hypothetical protein
VATRDGRGDPFLLYRRSAHYASQLPVALRTTTLSPCCCGGLTDINWRQEAMEVVGACSHPIFSLPAMTIRHTLKYCHVVTMRTRQMNAIRDYSYWQIASMLQITVNYI